MEHAEVLTMITIRTELPQDAGAREALLDAAYGPARFLKTSERLRKGRQPAPGLSFVAVENGRLVGTVRLWDVSVGADKKGLLLGPLAVAQEQRNCGIGSALVRHAIAEAARRGGHTAVLLVGDAPYYVRFGFSAEKTGSLHMPGPYEPERLLALELKAGALDGAQGVIGAIGLPKAKQRRTARAARPSSGAPVLHVA
jgi:predicted N-acetyltransferase YhbS